MSTTIHDSLNARGQSGAVDDTTDPDPEVLGAGPWPAPVLGEVQGADPR